MLYPYGEGGAVLSVWLLSGGFFYAVLEKIINGGIAMTTKKKDMHCYNSACYRLHSVCGRLFRMEKDRQGRLKKLTEGICAEGIVT